jgi:two-component system OmpR family response regulator
MDNGPENAAAAPNVLLVEDDPVAAEVLRTGLDLLGCRVSVVETGEKAMAFLQQSEVDWLLADIVLPGPIDGWMVGNEFRLRHPTRPVVFISAYEQKDISRRPFRSEFLYKPVKAARLVEVFHRLRVAA